MEDPAQLLKKIEKKERDFNKLWNRMDLDFTDLWGMKRSSSTVDYNTAVLNPPTRYPNDVNIVSNEARTFADEVISKLSSAKMQINVRMAEAEGEDKREEIGKLERLLNFALEKGEISDIIETQRGYYIIEKTDAQAFDEALFEQEKDTLKRTLLQQKQNEAFSVWFSELKEKADIKDYRNLYF